MLDLVYLNARVVVLFNARAHSGCYTPRVSLDVCVCCVACTQWLLYTMCFTWCVCVLCCSDCRKNHTAQWSEQLNVAVHQVSHDVNNHTASRWNHVDCSRCGVVTSSVYERCLGIGGKSSLCLFIVLSSTSFHSHISRLYGDYVHISKSNKKRRSKKESG